MGGLLGKALRLNAEAVGYFDHSLGIKFGVHLFLWYVSNPHRLSLM